jgi:pimeloyl-ACP methyl ester carboxylesterase
MKANLSELSIYYEVQGQGDPVILLHGWGVDSGSLRDVSTLLKEQTKSRIYTLDLPGFGFSDTPKNSWSVDNYVNLVLLFMEKMNISKALLFGHSFGGRIAIKLAANHPNYVDRLILVDSAGILPKRTAGYYIKVSVAKFIKRSINLFPILDKTSLYRLIYSKLGSEDYIRSGSLRDTFVKVVNEDLKSFMPRINCKTLLIWGERDESTPVSDAIEMRNLIPNSTLHIIKNAGHFSFLDNFQEFSLILLEFWRN